MRILCYGDSNTWGYIPNINGYFKDALIERYKPDQCWWGFLTHKYDIDVDGSCDRTISSENEWLEERNNTLGIKSVLKGQRYDLIFVQLGADDCKSEYGYSAKNITKQMGKFIDLVKKENNFKIIIISPSKIIENNRLTKKYYIEAEEKSKKLDFCYNKLAKSKKIDFISGLNAEVGEDGVNLTLKGHKYLADKVKIYIQNYLNEKSFSI